MFQVSSAHTGAGMELTISLRSWSTSHLKTRWIKSYMWYLPQLQRAPWIFGENIPVLEQKNPSLWTAWRILLYNLYILYKFCWNEKKISLMPLWNLSHVRKLVCFLLLFFGRFYGPSRLFHSFWAESIIRWGENRISPRKTIWPSTSRTWLVSPVTQARLEPTAVRWRIGMFKGNIFFLIFTHLSSHSLLKWRFTPKI